MTTESLVTFNDLEERTQAMGLKLRAKPGDRVVVIHEGLSYRVYVNNEFAAEVNGLFATKGPIADLFTEAKEFFGDFLADAKIEENGQTSFTFYPRHISFAPASDVASWPRALPSKALLVSDLI